MMSVDRMLGGPLTKEQLAQLAAKTYQPSIPRPIERELVELFKPRRFAIVKGAHLIKKKNESDGMGTDLYADRIAWCPSLGHVAEWRGRHGRVVAVVDEFGRLAGEPKESWTNWATIAHAAYERLGSDYGAACLDIDVRDPQAAEYDKMAELFPSFANQLSRPKESAWLFEIGDFVRVPKRWSALDFWKPRLDMHRLGFFDLNGEYSKSDLTNLELLFTLPLQPVSVRNSVSIDARSGSVVSRFKLGQTKQDELRGKNRAAQGWQEQDAWVCSEGARTLCWLA
jgi:hypothetical protein